MIPSFKETLYIDWLKSTATEEKLRTARNNHD